MRVDRLTRVRGTRSAVVVAAAYAVGGLPWSNIAARALHGVDLRNFETKTVSGTGLYHVAGAGPVVVFGLLDVAKGASAPLLARRVQPDQPGLPAVATAAVISGHNWSPYLGLAGGRGIAPALGALTVQAPEGALLFLAGLAIGRAAGETALGCLAAYLALPVVLGARRGAAGARLAAAVVVPMLAKRLLGNEPTRRVAPSAYLWRLVVDRDTQATPEQAG